MNKEDLNEYISHKAERQLALNKRREELEVLDVNLLGSKLGRFFGTSYLRLKRIITLVVGVALIIGVVANETYILGKILPEFPEEVHNVLNALLVVLGLGLLYVSHLIGQIRVRNSKISEAQSMTQGIILEYIDNIEYQNKDLNKIKSISNFSVETRPEEDPPEISESVSD